MPEGPDRARGDAEVLRDDGGFALGVEREHHDEPLPLGEAAQALRDARRVDRLIKQLRDEIGVTSIVVSHDLESIFTIADRIVMLYQGHVRMIGNKEDFRACSDEVVQQFITGRAIGPFE